MTSGADPSDSIWYPSLHFSYPSLHLISHRSRVSTRRERTGQKTRLTLLLPTITLQLCLIHLEQTRQIHLRTFHCFISHGNKVSARHVKSRQNVKTRLTLHLARSIRYRMFYSREHFLITALPFSRRQGLAASLHQAERTLRHHRRRQNHLCVLCYIS